MAITRIFKSGNSQAVRIPADIAYRDIQTELQITRLGDVITIYPARSSLKDIVAALREMPPVPIEERDPIEVPDRE